MLTERQKLVLIAIVEEYVKTNEPVGSLALSRRPELQYSSATIRNDMADLEDGGYLEKTHTSSGRIPSEKGYRQYVEEIMYQSGKTPTSFPMIDEIFERPNISKEEAIYESMDLVSQLTNYASIVLGKTAYTSRIKKLEFIDLKGPYAIILMVTDKGHVESKRIIIPEVVSKREVAEVVQVLDSVLHNALVSDIKNIIESPNMNEEIRDYLQYHEDLVDAFVEAFRDMAADKLHMTGRYNILAQPEFQDVGKVKELLSVIERKDVIKLIHPRMSGISIRIGNENEITEMKDCSVITVPYEANDGTIGSITIIGPTRMEYIKVIPLLEYIAKNIKKIV